MLSILGVLVVLEVAAILTSAGLCVFKQSKLKRRDAKRIKGDVGYGNGFPRNNATGGGGASMIFASGGTGDGGLYGPFRGNRAAAGAKVVAGGGYGGGDGGVGGDGGGDGGGKDGGDDGGGGGGGGSCGGGGHYSD